MQAEEINPPLPISNHKIIKTENITLNNENSEVTIRNANEIKNAGNNNKQQTENITLNNENSEVTIRNANEIKNAGNNNKQQTKPIIYSKL